MPSPPPANKQTNKQTNKCQEGLRSSAYSPAGSDKSRFPECWLLPSPQHLVRGSDRKGSGVVRQRG